ncbi:SDR family oxidoreductase [Pseudophaeobacter sp. EL27]|uniref:SDR family oxidoreductase n=1 Tax=Pseudophaeobacter sp. EL27 TaxID=2107580 RepID=UPI000EFD75AC|nr:SDR family oxidoreductase [Pseudophaeobacter sp. EL27]
MQKTLLCLGYGYTARSLAPQLLARGWRVIGTAREPVEVPGVEMITWPDEEISLTGVTHVLSSIGPGALGDPILAALHDEIAAVATDLAWFGYLSTTAVYGDRGGDWVDEATPVAPTSERGNWRALAERQWQEIPDLPLHIFRLAGIYGPGRGPFAKLMAGKARRIVKPGQVFSRIHVEDITQALLASMDQPNPGGIYNLCDDDPAPPQDVLGYAAELLGLPIPAEVPFDEAGMTPMARSFYGENKRVHNNRIKSELGVELLYPSYREGLRAVLAAEDMEAFVPPAEPPAL